MRVQPADDGRLRLRRTRGNMPRLAEILAGKVGELVIDQIRLVRRVRLHARMGSPLNESAGGASLFTALVEQLGLGWRPESAR